MNRKIDDLGRIVLPKGMRDKIGLSNGDQAKIELNNDEIIVSNPKYTGSQLEKENKQLKRICENIRDYCENEYFINAADILDMLEGVSNEN